MDKKASQVTSLDNEVRKGPWTMEEDYILINYIANHGEGVWNSLARSAGLKRTGKSCRLRWLNYLRPDVRRGNITPDEELLIMELHAKWGNRWSKIAKHLPGRTDNEIKNYWRTRIQKHLKQAESSSNTNTTTSTPEISLISYSSDNNNNNNHHEIIPNTNTISALSTNNIQNYVVSSSNDHDLHPPYLPSMDNPSSYHHHHHHHHRHHHEQAVDQISNIGAPQLHPDQPFNWETTEEDLWSMQLFNTYNNNN